MLIILKSLQVNFSFSNFDIMDNKKLPFLKHQASLLYWACPGRNLNIYFVPLAFLWTSSKLCNYSQKCGHTDWWFAITVSGVTKSIENSPMPMSVSGTLCSKMIQNTFQECWLIRSKKTWIPNSKLMHVISADVCLFLDVCVYFGTTFWYLIFRCHRCSVLFLLSSREDLFVGFLVSVAMFH